MSNIEKLCQSFELKKLGPYILENPHLAVSIGLFCFGELALWRDITPLAGSLFGAGGALLGAWITELNKRRTDLVAKAKRETNAVAVLAPELVRAIERVQYILDRAVANFICESSVNGVKTNDLQVDFRPYMPTLYPSASQVVDLAGAKAIAIVRFYDSLHDISNVVENWWEREGQLAVNIFNSIMHAAERSLRLSVLCISEFELDVRFPPTYESWGTLTSRIERSLVNASASRQHHMDRAENEKNGGDRSPQKSAFRKY